MTIDEARKELLDAVFEGATLREVIGLCQRILCTPLRFTPHNRPLEAILSPGYPYEDFLEWKLLVLPNGEPSDAYNNFMTQEFAMLHGTEPYIFEPRGPVTRRRILCIAFIDSRRMGHISVPELDIPLDELSDELIALCARFVALSYMQNEGPYNLPNDGKAMKLLLSDEKVTYQQVVAAASNQQFPPIGEYRLLALHTSSDGMSRQLALACGRLSSTLHTNWTLHTKQSAVILYERSAGNINLLSVLESFLRECGCACCSSPVFTDIMEARVWNRRLFALKPFMNALPGEIFRYESYADFGLYHETGLSREQLMAFVSSEVLAMVRFDEENHTEYAKTLRCYFENGCSQRRTALALFLHINTVAYRLQRIREQFGLSLDEPHVLIRTLQSLRLMAFLDG